MWIRSVIALLEEQHTLWEFLLGYCWTLSVEIFHEQIELVLWWSYLQIVINVYEYLFLCHLDLSIRLSTIGSITVISGTRWLNFLLLRRDVQTGDPNELQFPLLNVVIAHQVPISKVGGQPPSLFLQAELKAHFHGPVQQDTPVVPFDLTVLVQTVVLHGWVLLVLSFDHALDELFVQHEWFVPLLATARVWSADRTPHGRGVGRCECICTVKLVVVQYIVGIFKWRCW